ncbi:MAG TPA: YidC/Oxa1 family membrane protein insertase [bacterium]|nr:YidC/Oxa1 family membrane protein insertase [bacterium]HPL95711.1 YidC/Oxa1 family membrane protein insertase [bacterium]
MISQIYNTILYQPIFNLLVFFYNIIPGHDLGLAILLITIVLKLVLYPFSVKSIKAQKSLQELQPQINELRKKYKDNPQELTKQTMTLYRQQKVSPFSSCLPLLIQLPIFIAVYQVFRQGLANSQNLNILYPFIKNPGLINTISFGFLELSKSNIILAVLAGLAQFWVSKMLVVKKQPAVSGAKDEDMTAAVNKQMLYFMPLVTVFIGVSLPSGLTFYWLITTLLTGLQQWYVFKKINHQHENIGQKNY